MSSRLPALAASCPVEASLLTRRAVLFMGATTLSGIAVAQAGPELKTISIGVGPGWGAGGHAAIALKKGYFKDEGFAQVDLKFFAAGMMQLEAMISGAVNFTNAAQAPVLSLRGNGLPVVVLANTALADRSSAVAVRRSANVREPKQLEGLKIGVLKGSPAEQMLALLCKQYGIDLAKIQQVNLPPPAQLASLSTGAIDGIAVWQPWIQQASEKIPLDVVHTGTTSNFPGNKGEARRIDHTRTVLTSTEAFVRKNPQTVLALLRAYVKAQAFVMDPKNFAEMVSIYSQQFNEDPKLNELLLKDHESTLALDAKYVADMESVRDFLAASGRLRKPVAIKDLTDGAPLHSIDARLAPTSL